MIAVLAALVAQSPQTGSVAPRPDSAFVEDVRLRPDSARTALRRLLAAGSIAEAERLAAAYAIAWSDSFFVRQVARFRSLSPAEQQAKVAADSVRLAGNAALGPLGIKAAMRAWQESRRRFEALADTAGIAAALGNIGAAFYLAQEFDSAGVYLTRSRELALAIGDYRTAGNAIGTLASISKDRGELRQASELYARAGSLRERTGDARGLAADQNNLGLIAQDLGDLAGAKRAFQTALAANRGADRVEPAATNLVNLGNLATMEGEYVEASARYGEALAIYRAHGDRLDAASVLHNVGLLAMRRGDYPAAVKALTEATGIYRKTGPVAEELVARQHLADARAAMGDLRGARSELLRAESLANDRSSLEGLALARADLAVQFNQLTEAEGQYARAERLARLAQDGAAQAAAQQGLGMVLLLRERYARAETSLESALRGQDGSADRRAATQTRLLIGYGARQRGDTAAARRVILAALDTLQSLGDPAEEAAALGALGDLEAQAGLSLTAESLYHRGLARLGNHPAAGVNWQLHAGLAAALKRRGALDGAADELRAAIAEIERISAALPVEERRAAFLANKWDIYVQLALVEQARGQPSAAFEASERLRARQLLDLLARGRVAAANDTGLGLTAQEQDLRRRIGQLTRQLEQSPGQGSAQGLRGIPLRGVATGAIREALTQAQDAYGELLVAMREADPSYAALVHGEIAPSRDVMRSLGPTDALLEYLVGDSTTLLFVATADTLVTLDLNVTREALAALVDFARGTLALPAARTRDAWRAPLRRLFQVLVTPVEGTGLLAGKRRLLIAPHAELHYLPFAALVRPGPPEQPLIERYTLEYVPSASVWLRLRSRPTVPRSGDMLALAPRAAALPGSRAEVEAIARVHGGRARVLVGAAATERAFRALVSQQDIVHLATYGVLNKHNPLFSFVALNAGGGDDGRLEVHEVFGLKLSARLLVLSACQTGLASGALADVPAGDDWVGLVQAFLFAGAENVVATLWPVQDVATARFMERFYEGLARGQGEADALAEAQRTVLRDPNTRHPFYWAGFALAGGR